VTTTLNGYRPATPLALALTLPPLGVPRLPMVQPPDDTVTDDVPAPMPARQDDDTATRPAQQSRRSAAVRWPAPDGDTVITWAMTSAATLVILFAAIVSYSHIHALAVEHHEDSLQSHLLPLSIDGVIAEASLVMLFAARHRPMPTPPLARVMLWSGIIATLGANALVALPPQWISPVASAVIGAVLSAWPAAAFIGSVELIMRLVRDLRAVTSGDNQDDSQTDTKTDRTADKDLDNQTDTNPEGTADKNPDKNPDTDADNQTDTKTDRTPDKDADSEPDSEPDKDADQEKASRRRAPRRPNGQRRQTPRAKAAAILSANPDLSNAEVAVRLKGVTVSAKTIQRARDDARRKVPTT
jgi:hypothetical protein